MANAPLTFRLRKTSLRIESWSIEVESFDKSGDRLNLMIQMHHTRSNA
jgi:hypothetical protein